MCVVIDGVTSNFDVIIDGRVITMLTRDPTVRGSHIACRPAKQTSSNQRWSRVTLSAITRLEIRPAVTWPLPHCYTASVVIRINSCCILISTSLFPSTFGQSQLLYFSFSLVSLLQHLYVFPRLVVTNLLIILAPDNPRM